MFWVEYRERVRLRQNMKRRRARWNAQPENSGKKIWLYISLVLALGMAIVVWTGWGSEHAYHGPQLPRLPECWIPDFIESLWKYLVFELSGLLGLAIAVFGAAQAYRAQSRAGDLIRELEVTQKVVRESPQDYPEVFDEHIIHPLERANEIVGNGHHPGYMNLIISTPAYGYHVLGLDAYNRFEIELSRNTWAKHVVLNAPDTHFYHVANTLIWEHLFDRFASHSRIARLKITSATLRSCIIQTIGTLRSQIAQLDAGDLRDVQVWITEQIPFRMTSFEYPNGTTLGYIVLADTVTLQSNLLEFNGRAIAIPDTLYRQIVGRWNDPKSFMHKIETCPYTLRMGDNAALSPEEIDLLGHDYVFLRTQHILFDLRSFSGQLRGALRRATGTELDTNSRLKTLQEILSGVSDYFAQLYAEREWLSDRHAPTQSDQWVKLAYAQSLRDAVSEPASTRAAKVQAIIEDYVGKNPNSWFSRSYHENRSWRVEPQEATPWVVALYFLISSGFRESRLAQERIKQLDL